MKKVGPLHIILLAGLLHGLLYVFLLPPWQHYDEPGHFEFAWLIANRSRFPSPGEYDQGMRREVAASMEENAFFKDLSLRPNLLDQYKPVWIGIDQTDNPPLYYWIAAIPLRLVPTSDITFQLYLCRLVSLLFYLLTILTGYGVSREMAKPENPVRWLLPLTLVMLPGFADLMTAVNNDVGAVTFFSLFLWASIRMIHRGFSIIRLLTTGLLAATCFMTKNTAAIAVPLLIFPILFSFLRGRRQCIAWALIGSGIFFSALLTFTWGDAAYWYQPTVQNAPTRIVLPQTPLGNHAFQIDASTGSQSDNLVQLLSPNQVQSLRGERVTLGYWIWANQPVRQTSPILKDERQTYSEIVNVTQKPTYHVFTAVIAGSTAHIQIVLEAPVKPGTIIYMDGLVLMRGDLTQSKAPVFSDAGGQRGTWGEKSFVNPIRNASAEQVWPRPRVLVQRLLVKISPIQPNMILTSLVDWKNSRWYYRATAKQLLRTFWGQFGWGHIHLSGNIYIALGLLTILGVLGSLAGLWRDRKYFSSGSLALLAAASSWIWGVALVRGIHSIAGSVFIPSARYAFPAIIPTVYLLCTGWDEWPRLFERWLHIPSWVKLAVFLVTFLLLDMLSIWTIAHFYGKL